MKFFLDTADTAQITALHASGLVDGVTTNPSLIAAAGAPMADTLRAIAAAVPGPVSAEVVAREAAAMTTQGKTLAAIAPNIAVKLPATWDGIRATGALAAQGIAVNVTLCFSANQALLAAKAGARYISPFIGRLDDAGIDGMELIEDIRSIYDNYPDLETEILAASIRHVGHIKDAAIAGADIATLPPKLLRALVAHPLTDAGLEKFEQDWRKSGQNFPSSGENGRDPTTPA